MDVVHAPGPPVSGLILPQSVRQAVGSDMHRKMGAERVDGLHS